MAGQRIAANKPFGTSVRVWRNRLGISQEELAARAGLHRTYICDVERGARNVTLRSIEKLAQALEISVPSLLSYERGPDALGNRPDAFGEGWVDILMVEDDPADVELAKEGLKPIANRIHVARDGQEALDYLFGPGKSGPDTSGRRPQLILLDLGLPKIGGLEVLRRIKNDPNTAAIPVIVLTISSRHRDLQTCQQLGAVAYITKPVDLHNLSRITPQLKMQWVLVKSDFPTIATRD